MEIKNIILTIFLINACLAHSQYFNEDILSFEMNKYNYTAKQELKFRYNNINQNDTIFDNNNNLSKFFKLEDLTVYSIPVFEIKRNEKNSKFLNLIDFESNSNKQEVIVENNNRIVSVFHVRDSNFRKDFNAFTRVNLFLIYYKFDYNNKVDFPIMLGGITYDYFTKERFETKYFCFRIDGLKGLFFLKDDKLFYATKRSPNNKTNEDYDSYKEYYNDIKTEIFEVNKHFECIIKDEIKNQSFLNKRLKCK